MVFNGNLITLGRDHVVRQYDPATLQIVDSLASAGEIVELTVLDQENIEVVTRQSAERL